MRCLRLLSRVVPAGLGLALVASTAHAQADPSPAISERSYVSGSAKVTVTGSFQFDEEIAINTKASISGGDMTWLQFGNSGDAAPNALVTYQPGEVGIILGKGKFTATGGVQQGEKSDCTGKTEVTKTLITGHYTCKGITSYNPATGKMGKLDFELSFTAKS